MKASPLDKDTSNIIEGTIGAFALTSGIPGCNVNYVLRTMVQMILEEYARDITRTKVMED